MKKLKKISLISACVLVIFSLVACSSRQPVSAIDFKAACLEVNLVPTEQNASSVGEANLKALVTATTTESDTQAEIIEYDNDSSAKSLYATILDSIKNENGTVEKQVDSSTYSKYFIRTGDNYAAVVRVGSSIFYGSESDGSGTIKSLLEKIGYN